MTSTILAKKRQQLHSKIRTQYIQNYMNKIRYELHQQQLTANMRALNQLIEETSQKININQLKTLVNYANDMDQNNAIIHIGNLVIDQVVTIEDILQNKLEIVPKNSRYWLWLIRVILSVHASNSHHHNSPTTQLLYSQWQANAIQYTFNKFLTTQQTFSITQSLQIIKLLTSTCKLPTIHSLITSNKGVLIKIKDFCLHFDKRVSQLSYQLLDQIIESGDFYTIQLITTCSLSQIERILILGFSKLDHSQRKFPLMICRMVNNIYASKVSMSENMLKACINGCLNPYNNQRVRVEFSYLWLTFCQSCTVLELQTALQNKLFVALQSLLSNVDKKNSKTDNRIIKNMQNTFDKICQKSQLMDEKKQLQINSNIMLIVRECGLINQHINQNTVQIQQVLTYNNLHFNNSQQKLTSSQMDIQ